MSESAAKNGEPVLETRAEFGTGLRAHIGEGRVRVATTPIAPPVFKLESPVALELGLASRLTHKPCAAISLGGFVASPEGDFLTSLARVCSNSDLAALRAWELALRRTG